MHSDILVDKFVSNLTVVNFDQYRCAERVPIDSRDTSRGNFVYKWEQSTAGSDPYSWTEEYYRIVMPLTWIWPLIENAINNSESEGLVPGHFWSNEVAVNTYTGDGGEQKLEPTFDENSWMHELTLVRVKFTQTSVRLDFKRWWSSPLTC